MRTVTFDRAKLARAYCVHPLSVSNWARNGTPIDGVITMFRTPGGEHRFVMDVAWLERCAPHMAEHFQAQG